MGDIEIELYAEDAPVHVENFLKLVKERFYVGTTFHRIVPGFVIQGGDPNTKDYDRYNDGLGGPGYTLPAEIKLIHKRGSVAAARLGGEINPQMRSSGSQFYICLNDLPGLDRAGYTVFGHVLKGMEVVDKIAAVKRDENDNPTRRIVMENVYLN
jgi:cyclophilin family peptidyl-prolyl cis-trans isomerase